jgi:hypothetical protein
METTGWCQKVPDVRLPFTHFEQTRYNERNTP